MGEPPEISTDDIEAMLPATRHAVVDADGLVVNVVMWDGVTLYNPGDGLELVPLNDDSAIGPDDIMPGQGG